MKKRIISLLAIIAMLCSMVIVVLPAMAADDATLAPYEAVLEDIASGAANLTAEVAKGAEATPASLLAAAQADAAAIQWKTFSWKEEPYPRYAYHAAYAAAGYDGKNYSITLAEDWTEMNTVANEEKVADYFSGVTFHLTNNVDFAKAAMMPLGCAASTMYFSGTINGHGFGFDNVSIFIGTGNRAQIPEYTTTIAVGLIARLGNCKIQDFGVNSGIIGANTGNGTGNISTFGRIDPGKTPVFERVWSGATLYSGSNPHLSALAGTYNDQAPGGLTVNGFTFDGKLIKTQSHGRNGAAFIFGGYQVASSDNGTYKNIIADGEGYNLDNVNATITASGTQVSGTIVAPETQALHTYLFRFSTKTAYESAAIENVYGITDKTYSVKKGYYVGANTTTAGDSNELLTAMSAVEAAWEINDNPTATNPVYFTLNGDKVRPTDDATNKIIKVVVSGVTNQTFYMNANTDLSMAAFAEKINYDPVTITGIKVNGVDHELTAPLNFTDDATVEVSVTKAEALTAVLEKYKDIKVEHLAAVDAGKVSLQEFRDAAAAAGDNETKIQEVLDMVPNLQIKVTEVVADLPVFSDYAIYKDYNENQNWLIKTADDWKAMMTAADASTTTNSKGTPNYFKGYTFHLVQDVDFAEAGKISMMGVGKMFSGNINGHGYGFKNFTFEYNGGNTPANHKVGMMQMFEGTMQDFGINSGSFTAKTTGGSLEMGMIGGFASGNGAGQETSAKILRVWNHASSMTASGHASNNISALVGYHAQDVNAVINGFYTTVTLPINDDTNGGMSGVTASNSRGLKVYNVISDTEAEYLLVYGGTPGSDEATVTNAVVKNVYTTGTENFFVNYSKVPYANSVNSGAAKAENAFEAAMKINAAQDPADSIEDIYFVVKDGKLCFGAKENRVRKVTLTGFNTGVYYFSANTAIDLVEEFGFIPSGQIATVTGSASAIDGTILNLGDEDITLDIIFDCDHAEGFTYTATENAHIKACKLGCGYSYELPCTAESYTNNAPTFEKLLAGEKATHSGTCEFCGEAFTQDCTVTYVVSEEAGVDNCWDYSECDCGRANVAHKDTADMLGGDANGDGKIDLLDALRMLRHLVDQSVQLNEKNANLDSDAAVTVAEVRKVVRFWLGDPLVIDEVKAHQNYMNASNLFNFTTATEVRLNQNGSEVASDDYVASASIEVKKGNKVTFGPVRPTQAVYGYAYDAQMNPIEPIAFDNTKVVLTFANKAVLACYEVPEGVAYIKLSAETEYADKYVARFNSNMTLIEYETRTNADVASFKNILKGKTVLTVGDSICAAGADYADANGLRGWARHIAKEYDAIVTNSGVSGAAFSDCRYNRSGVPTSQIYHQIGQHVGTKSFDYILLHGGVNDAWDDIDVGEVSDSFNPDDFDITTYAGGMEMAIYTAVKNYGDIAAIGYLINFESPLHSLANDTGKYFEVGRQICDKWGIKYLDLYNDVEFDTENLTVVKNGVADKIHPTAEGYEVLAPYINAFMTEMRPVSYDIYSQIN